MTWINRNALLLYAYSAIVPLQDHIRFNLGV